MLNRSLETDVMDVCNNEKLGIVVYSPLAQGLLTGKYDRNNTPADSRLASEVMNAWFPSKRMDENYFDMQDQLKAKAKEWGMNMGQLALNWVLAHKPITSAIIGASRPEQVEDNVAALSHTLTTEQVDQIDVILDNAPVDQYTGLRIGYGIIKRGY
jgi:L-glyceraldehyde 3-phosphate reductase